MKYEVTRACGHTERVDIYGTDAHGEHARKLE